MRLGSLLVPFPQYTGAGLIRGAVGDSVYHGLTLRAERAFSHGLMFQASYTAAKLIDDVNERFIGGTNYDDPYNLGLSRSISAATFPSVLSRTTSMCCRLDMASNSFPTESQAVSWATGRPAVS